MQLVEKELKNNFQIVKQDELTAAIILTASKDWAFYQGHFPGMPVLPGYAIMEVSVFFAQKIFDQVSNLVAVNTLRMRNPILPGLQMELIITKNKDENRFQITWKSATAEKMVLASIDFELSTAPHLKELRL